MIKNKRNNDTKQDYVEVLSLLGYKLDPEAPAVFVRHETSYFVGKGNSAKRVAIQINENPMCPIPEGKKAISEKRSHTSIAMNNNQFVGNTIVVQNEFERLKKVLCCNNKFLLNLLATAPEMTDDRAVLQIKDLPENLHEKLFDKNNNIKDDASLKTIIDDLKILNKNPYYEKMTEDCRQHNHTILQSTQDFKFENTNEDQFVLTNKRR